MYLDRIKAKKLLQVELKKRTKIVEACLVLTGDEAWNTETIWKNGKFVNKKDWQCYFCSFWAMPALVIYYKNGTERRIPCYFTEADDRARADKLNAWGEEKTRKSIAVLKKFNKDNANKKLS